jgi:signal transduction histidine kinase
LRSRNVERNWPEIRESLIQTASERLDESLGEAVDLARGIVAGGAAVAEATRSEAMRALQNVVSDSRPEHGVVILDETGNPWAWAGRHRVAGEPASAELFARITPFYVLLEASRQVGGRTVVGHVVLEADSAVPDQEWSMAWRFAQETGSNLEFFARGAAPPDADVFDYCLPSCDVPSGVAIPDTLFSVRPVPPSQGSMKLELLASGGRWAGVLTILLLALLTAVGGRIGRWSGVLGIVAVLVLTPTGERIGLGPLFSSAIYFDDLLGPFSASAGALLLSAALLVIAFLQLCRRSIPRTIPGTLVAAALVLLWPVILQSFSRGISLPTTSIGIGTWLSWQLTLTGVGGAVGLAATFLFGRRERPVARGITVWALLMVASLAVLGLLTWQPTGGWPVWYGLLWIPAVWLAVQPAPRPRLFTTVTAAAGTAAALLTWGAVLDQRLVLAEYDASRLRGGDAVAIGFLERFQVALQEEGPPMSAAELYARWRRALLSRYDYPGVLATWASTGELIAELELAQLNIEPDLFASISQRARNAGAPVVGDVEVEPGLRYVGAVPYPDGTVVTVAVAPQSQIIRPVLVGRFLRGERRLAAPYEMFLGEPVPTDESGEQALTWRREGWTLRATQPLRVPGGVRHLHAVVEVRDLSQLLVRGTLFLLIDLGLLVLVGFAGEMVSGRLTLPAALPEAMQFRSYRIRLTAALAVFFVVPTLGFATWSIGRLQAEAVRRGDLLIQQTLRDAVGSAEVLSGLRTEEIEPQLERLAEQLGTDLMWFEAGVLTASSARVLVELGLTGMYLAPDVYLALAAADALEVTTDASIGGQETRVGYRNLGGVRGLAPVLAAPRLVDVTGLHREQEDLGLGLMLATLLGLAGAAGLAALAARSLSHPVQSLRTAALAVGSGEELPPFDPRTPTEFASVVDAFQHMASDVESSQAALEGAQRRTAAVLANVATAVVALDRRMQVTLANPRAQELLGVELDPGLDVRDATWSDWEPVWNWVAEFMRGANEHEEREFAIQGRRIRAQIAALLIDPRGCVVALDDTTEMARAVRVLAWGEIARQVAHEIKNPLTPIRLGVQHLQRARRHGAADFDATLEKTSHQILAEIERLDAIARAFARFGAPPADALPRDHEDLTAIARDAAALYALGGGTAVRLSAAGPVIALVRKDEVKEVLINLVENARDAGATAVMITVEQDAEGQPVLEVRDNGRGIPEEDLSHIFEPHFSTTTSGTGLGLAICKRLVESWGATITVASEGEQGTTVRVVLVNAGS